MTKVLTTPTNPGVGRWQDAIDLSTVSVTVVSSSPSTVSGLGGTQVILVDVVPCVVNLPDIADNEGLIIVKDRTGQAEPGVNEITLTPVGGQTIDTEATFGIDGAYASLTVYGEGSNWSLL